MDANGLESGWVELVNTSDKWADLADYRFIRVNRGKKTDPYGEGNFPPRLVAPHSRTVFYTSERYPNSDTPEESAFATGTFDAKPAIYSELGNILVWGKKVNPKKSPFVRLYYAPGGDGDAGSVVDTVVIPSDLPEGCSIIVGDGAATRRWLCKAPTRGEANDTDGCTRLGPNAGPLYEIPSQKASGVASEFALPSPPAVPGEDYIVEFAMNPVMNPDGTFAPRDTDEIRSISIVYRKDLDDATLTTNAVDMATLVRDDAAWGDKYTAKIPAGFFPARGRLIQWKFLVVDGEGTEWTSPSFNNPDDGYEWYGTIVEPGESLLSKKLPTWHLFADAASLAQMDKDAADQDASVVPNNARVGIYDSSTSNYYDYVRIDLRGHTSGNFKKKGHGLRFAKAHPLTMTDVATGEQIEEIRKTSLISEFADPSKMRQMIAFWLFRKTGNLAPFDFPVRCNLNGEFYQLAFNSERFTDELIEDVYGLDKFGWSWKNVGTLKSGSGTTAGGIEKKTPDDEDESNITVLQNELRARLAECGADNGNEDTAALTKFVVEKFNLPAWINYLASARITHEMDDVWANVCIYYDNALMAEGVRGTDTWMPLGYDFNLSFGQYYLDGGVYTGSLMADEDWFKSHPFYGGNRVRCYTSSARTTTINNGNNGFEAVLQSSKFRRLYLRRLRTLMDQELKEPGTAETEVPFIAKMREMADLMREDAALDDAKWPNDSSDDKIDCWKNGGRPADIDKAIDEIWEKYVVPRREHLYVTHSVTNTAREIGYGSQFIAGIPEAQSPIGELKANISVVNMDGELFHDTEKIIIRNANDETIDMSGWRLAFSVDFTFPAGTVCDANDTITIVADRRSYIAANTDALTDEVIIGNATFTGAGPLALYDADGALVFSAIPETDELNFLRLHSFCGKPEGDNDANEWFVLTNISDSATLDLAGATVCFLKQGDTESDSHCHITLENKKHKGEIPPLGSMRFEQADWSKKGWTKIQNNKLYITIGDRYGSTAQHLAVEQKKFNRANGNGGWLVCDSTASTVASNGDWHEEYYLTTGETGDEFTASSAEEAAKIASHAVVSLSEDDILAGLETQYLAVAAQAVEGKKNTWRAVVDVNAATVAKPEIFRFEPATGDDGRQVGAIVANPVLGLWYGFETSEALGANAAFVDDEESFVRPTYSTDALEIHSTPSAAPSAFFRVKVKCSKIK